MRCSKTKSFVLSLFLVAVSSKGLALGDVENQYNHLYHLINESASSTSGAHQNEIEKYYRLHFTRRIFEAVSGARPVTDDELIFYTRASIDLADIDIIANQNYLNNSVFFFKKIKNKDVRRVKFLADDIVSGYIANGERRKAIQFNRRYNKLTSVQVPRIENYQEIIRSGNKNNLVYELLPEGKLRVSQIDLSQPVLIVVSSYLCHFCRKAVRSIDKNSEIRTLISNHSIWITPPTDLSERRAVQTWNNKFPNEHMVISYSYGSWKVVNKWLTPTFLFFKDNTIEKKVVGWPGPGQLENIKAGFDSIGLSTSDNK